MPEDFDFDSQNSDLTIGIEIEYPAVADGEKYVHRGDSTNGLQTEAHLPSHIGGSCVYDATVGAEFVSDPLALEDAESWYRDVIEFVEAEYNTEYQPVGLMRGGNTAGTHIHISDLTEEQARELAELSDEPWMQILFCSSIANDDSDGLTWPVFRGGRYCQMEYNPSEHYAVVNHRGHGHYEWRLPEPMAPDHIDILTTFLRAFEQSTDAAIEYAQEVLDNGDDRITSIKRAEKVGMDIENVPTVERRQDPNDPENFYERVVNAWHLPEIRRVEHQDTGFYILESSNYDDGTFMFDGIPVPANGILYADSLEPVEDDVLRQEVNSILNRGSGQSRRETEATNQLKEIIKKKKGKA